MCNISLDKLCELEVALAQVHDGPSLAIHFGVQECLASTRVKINNESGDRDPQEKKVT